MTDKNFVFWCQKTIPLVFDNSMSYYECLCKLLNYVNSLTTDVAEIARLQEELQNYVDNYFTNLDVQTEINNKLDEMVTDGTLEQIINEQIFNELNEKIENLELGKINEEIILIGDSYLAGQGLTNPETENFGYVLMQKLNMSTENFHIWVEGGSSFTNQGNQGHNWLQLVQTKISEINQNNITKVIFAGGYNDINANSADQIKTAMANTLSETKNLFPNAKIYLCLIGNNGANSTAGANARNLLKNRIYNVYNKCSNYNTIFIDKGQLALQNYSLYENNERAVHPNAQGQKEIANWLFQNLSFGSVDYGINFNAYNANTPESFTGNVIFSEKLLNNKLDFMVYTDGLIGSINKGEVNINFGNQPLKLMKYNSIATGNNSGLGFIRIGNSSTNIYNTIPACWYLDSSNNLHLKFQNDYENINKIISNWNSFIFDVNKI